MSLHAKEKLQKTDPEYENKKHQKQLKSFYNSKYYKKASMFEAEIMNLYGFKKGENVKFFNVPLIINGK